MKRKCKNNKKQYWEISQKHQNEKAEQTKPITDYVVNKKEAITITETDQGNPDKNAKRVVIFQYK